MDHGRINILAAVERLLTLPSVCKHISQDDIPECLLTDAVNWLDDFSATNPNALAALESMPKESTRYAVVSAATSLMDLLEAIPGKEARRLVAHPEWTEVERRLVHAYVSLLAV